MDTMAFFKNLKESDWDIPVTKKWRVKDVASHLIGWERECAKELVKVFETGNEPWFVLNDNYDEFNERTCREFKDYSPKALISELEKWHGILDDEIKKIGEDKIKQRPNMDWVFDEGDESHFEHHIKQIKNAIEKSRSIKNFYAGGFLYNPQTKSVLLHKRDLKAKINPGYWAFFGGLNEGKETPRQAFLREIKEELNIEILPAKVKPLCDYLNEELQTYRYVFYVESNLEKTQMRLAEGEGFAWLPLVEVFKCNLTEKTAKDLKLFLRVQK